METTSKAGIGLINTLYQAVITMRRYSSPKWLDTLGLIPEFLLIAALFPRIRGIIDAKNKKTFGSKPLYLVLYECHKNGFASMEDFKRYVDERQEKLSALFKKRTAAVKAAGGCIPGPNDNCDSCPNSELCSWRMDPLVLMARLSGPVPDE